MSVLVKGMEMPKTCLKCPIVGFEFTDSRNGFANGYFKCNALNKNIEDVMYHGRLRDCPLFELKDLKDIRFCLDCEAKMKELEDIPMEYFESGGR